MANEKFNLMQLPYAPDALEPVISRETIAVHHGKHLQAYVNNLNALLLGSPHSGRLSTGRSWSSVIR